VLPIISVSTNPAFIAAVLVDAGSMLNNVLGTTFMLDQMTRRKEPVWGAHSDAPPFCCANITSFAWQESSLLYQVLGNTEMRAALAASVLCLCALLWQHPWGLEIWAAYVNWERTSI
jgi:hypothetical protein